LKRKNDSEGAWKGDGIVKKKILIIDDDAALRYWFADVLSEAGYDCHQAESGDAGVALAGVFLPDVILCDIEMPDTNGYEVIQRLLLSPKTALIPFIFITGRDGRDEVRKGMTLGADDYLTKPMTAAELLDSVRVRLYKKKSLDIRVQTRVQRAKDLLTHEVSYDRLTRLPNRQLLLKQFRKTDQTHYSVDSLAILSVGVDNLSNIADAFGPRCEQIVLRASVRRLKRQLGSGALIYRGKHDSFDIVLRNVKDKPLETLMKEITRALSESICFKKQVLRVKVSMGCSFYDPHENTQMEIIVTRAETARHYASKEAEDGYRLYLPEMQRSVFDRLTLENRLYKALKNNEFLLFYQPQVDIKTGRIKAVEALLRWKNSELGMISPLHFIPLAEENGLINPIGTWVLEESCRQIKKWKEAGLDLTVAVNVSGRQFESGELPDIVENTLKQSGVEPASLELEITESLLMKDSEKILAQMTVLKTKGILFAIDDFGTGYSSLSSLKKFPFDTLKIDRSFVTGIETHASNTEIAATIIKMAKTLKLKTLAEGVETREQLECLKGLHCGEYQGFLFSRPLPASEVRLLLEKTLTLKKIEV